MTVWKVGKTIIIHRSSSMLWEMIVSNLTCMKFEYIRLKHAKWTVWSFNELISSCVKGTPQNSKEKYHHTIKSQRTSELFDKSFN
ncbi:hypothetical protein LDENG_00212320, partial [Lucifuga dentata]